MPPPPLTKVLGRHAVLERLENNVRAPSVPSIGEQVHRGAPLGIQVGDRHLNIASPCSYIGIPVETFHRHARHCVWKGVSSTGGTTPFQILYRAYTEQRCFMNERGTEQVRWAPGTTS